MNKENIEAECREEHIGIVEEAGLYQPDFEKAAQKLRAYCENETSTILDFDALKTIAGKLDVDVFVTSLPDGVTSLFVPAEDTIKSSILLAEGLSMREARFLIGHGLAHIVLHHTHTDSVPLSSMASTRKYLKNEYEANYVAGALLMDERVFKNDPDIDIHAIEIVAEKYDVSYETAAHRTAILSDIDMYFIKIDNTGKILKRYIKTEEDVNWVNIEKICNKWGVWKAYVSKSSICFAQKSVLLDNNKKIVDIFYFASKFVEKKDGQYAIGLGCKYDDAVNLKGFVDNLQPVEISTRTCPYPKTCELRLCYSSFAPV